MGHHRQNKKYTRNKIDVNNQTSAKMPKVNLNSAESERVSKLKPMLLWCSIGNADWSQIHGVCTFLEINITLLFET